MRAAILSEYGPPEVLKPGRVETPVPGDDEIMVRVRAASVSFGDRIARNFRAVTPRSFSMPMLFWLISKLVFGIRKPRIRILGGEFAGDVVAIGSKVTRFAVGERVFGYPGASFGAYAEYLCIRETGMVELQPANTTHEEAAAMPYGGVTALNLLSNVDIMPGRRVLIIGASGGIGSAAVQLAKHYGAHVTGVCGTPRVEMVRALGADRVIDYTREDFRENGETYDVIFDVLGKSSFVACRDSLTGEGVYLPASFKSRELLQMLWTRIRGGKRVVCALAMEKPEDLAVLKRLVEAGALQAIVDRSFPLERAAEAHAYVEAGDSTGRVLITV